MGFLGGSDGKESACNAGDLGSIPGGRSPGGGHAIPLQHSCLENPHGQRSLVGYSPWGPKEADMTECLSTHTTRYQDSPQALQFIKCSVGVRDVVSLVGSRSGKT